MQALQERCEPGQPLRRVGASAGGSPCVAGPGPSSCSAMAARCAVSGGGPRRAPAGSAGVGGAGMSRSGGVGCQESRLASANAPTGAEHLYLARLHRAVDRLTVGLAWSTAWRLGQAGHIGGGIPRGRVVGNHPRPLGPWSRCREATGCLSSGGSWLPRGAATSASGHPPCYQGCQPEISWHQARFDDLLSRGHAQPSRAEYKHHMVCSPSGSGRGQT